VHLSNNLFLECYSDPTFNAMDIYVYEYPSPKTERTYSINELAENMRLRLSAAGIFQQQEIIFLSHSMGGLVTRALLLKYRDLARKVKALYFFATPTTGSEAAQLGKLLSSNPQLGQMLRMDSATFLADLQRDWLAANLPIQSYCAYETKTTFGIRIVEQQSATNLCNKRVDPIDTNHIDIVKPADDQDTPYLAFKAAFREIYPATEEEEAENFKFRLHGCVFSGGNVTCTFTVTNTGSDALLTLRRTATWLSDNLGDKYRLAEASIGNQKWGRNFIGFPSTEMRSNVPVQTRLVFSGLSEGATRITKLIVMAYRGPHEGGRLFDMSFQDIALSRK
jgi:pimeloyl-ACP methyl ester carboxylesterase